MHSGNVFHIKGIRFFKTFFTNMSRVGLEKYYTAPDVVRKCVSSLKGDHHDIIVEPSAGGGAFVDEIKSLLNLFNSS